jgi:tetratricopeptide (TPR) repeat protein
MPGGWVLDDFSLLGLELPEAIAWGRRPLTYLTYWLNFALGPAEAWGFRAGNILLHIAAVQCCFGALRELLGERKGFWAALVFAVHPLQAEAVLYVFARPVVLMSILVWAAIEQWAKGRYWLAVALGGLALGAKEEAVALPVFLLLLGGPRIPLLASFALAAGAGWVTLRATAEVAGSGAGVAAGIGALDYLATQVASLARYAREFVLPFPLVFDDPVAALPRWAALAWVGILAAIWWKRGEIRQRTGVFWLVAALVFLGPTTSVFPLADYSTGRRMYLAVACAAAAVLPLVRGNAVVAAALAGLSLVEGQRWSSAERVWRWSYEHTETLRPALELARVSPAEEARKIVESRRGVGEGKADFHTELGRLDLAEQNAAGALRHFGRALALDPERPSHYYNRGVALAALGQREAAREDFERTLRMDPRHRMAREAITALAR